MTTNQKSIIERYIQTLSVFSTVTPDQYKNGKQCYLAVHNLLPGCMSHGDSAEAALENLKDACELYLESKLAQGQELPPIQMAISSGTCSSFQWQTFVEEPPQIQANANASIPSFVTVAS